MFNRGGMLYAQIKGADGKWRQTATGFRVDERPAAERWVRDTMRDIERNAPADSPASGSLTAWVETWATERHELAVDGNNDAARLRKYILPRLGDMLLREIETKHLAQAFREIRTTPIETGKPPAPRTVHNVYSALCATLRDAQIAGRISQSPCILTEHQLGTKIDATPGWRTDAVFTRDEAQTMISTLSIPWDRRVAYAIELLAALRPGENAMLRWRHYDPAQKPLGSLFVGEALNSKRGTSKRTKTDTEKHVPVHPTLAAILAEWKLSGWAEMMGHAPGPDDLIVPLPPADARARTKRHEAEPFRTNYYAGRRWRDEDLPALGWRDRRHYDLRATFVTIALEDGADEHILETRVTHTRKTRSAFSGYNRGKQWAIVCAEVSKLRISRVSDVELGAVVVQSSASPGKSLDSLASGSSSWLRRRASKTRPDALGSTEFHDPRRSYGDEVEPDGAERKPTALSHGARCDAGLAAIRAAAGLSRPVREASELAPPEPPRPRDAS